MILAGLDEAALGPSLGPFTACLIRFSSDSSETSPDLYQRLAEIVSPEATAGRIAVGDSKKLFTPAAGPSLLETAVSAFLKAGGFPRPGTFRELIELLAPGDVGEGPDPAPWFEEAEEIRLPAAGDFPEQAADRLAEILIRENLVFMRPMLRFVPAGRFNRLIDENEGKAGAIRKVLDPLMESVLNSGEKTVFNVDRQGGRRYYGEWLAELAPGRRLTAGEEGPQRSVYHSGDHQVSFQVKADAVHLEVALASMFAKYVRELAMELFNRWWSRKVPRLKPTAGYPQDAKRFLADLEAAGAMPEDRDLLVRRL